MNLTYTWNTGHNNGQAASVTDALSGEQITYTYDLLNRLIQAQTTQNHTQYPNAPWWGQAYTYDGFGNLLTKTPVGPGNSTVMSLSVDPNTNHFTGSGYGYDANGNVTTLPQSSGNLALSYDVENRFQMSGGVLMFDMENQPLYDTGTGKYSVWDLNGRRLRHESITIGVNPPAGQAIPNYSITDRNVYFGGRLIQSNSKTVLVDRLGSVRANESGEKFEYLPYGEEFNLTSQNREKFATYTRSSANGLDYAINRWYDSVHGNFITPDPHTLSMDLSNPGTMNRYAYVGGDPINSTDPQGLDYLCVNGMLTFSFESCMPDLADPGFGADGLGNIPCGDGSMISAFASPAEIANCQAPILGPEGPGAAVPIAPVAYVDCGTALKRLKSAIARVEGRIADIMRNGGVPDPGHKKALQQAVDSLKSALSTVSKSCLSLAAAAAAVAAAEAAIEAAGPYLAIAGAVARGPEPPPVLRVGIPRPPGRILPSGFSPLVQ